MGNNIRGMKEKIIEIIADKVSEKVEDISLSQRLRDDLFLDSLDIMEICMEAERVFEISIPDEDMCGWDTVQDIVNTVNAIRNESGD